ncbi:tyrosinase-like [Oculina patagonica]
MAVRQKTLTLVKIFGFLLLAHSTANATNLSTQASPTNLSLIQPLSLDDGETTQCEHGSIVYNECNDECECQHGKLVKCYRVRREFTQMSMADRRRYIEAYKRASIDPLFVDGYSNLVGCHIMMPQELLHLTPILFLPWHRWYLLQWENLLRKIDCRITLPFWDWSHMATNWWRETDPTDVWNSGDHGLGGNGVPPENCVEHGPFRKDVWSLTAMAGGHCLRRRFNYSMILPNRKEVLDALSSPASKYSTFEQFLRFKHVALHAAVRGAMIFSNGSSNAPEFIFLHSFVDKIWTTWQNKGDDYKFASFSESKIKLPFSSTYGWQWLDNDNLPGGIKIRYEDVRDGMENAM